MFPGQGTPRGVGGQDVVSSSPLAQELIARAGDVHEIDLRPALGDPAAAPPDTITAQLATFVTSVSLADRLLERSGPARVVSGHSLGEFSALVAGGWLTAGDGLDAVARRAQLMHESCLATEGAMSAIVGLQATVIESLIRELGVAAVVANRNGATQIVVSGPRADVDRLGSRAQEAGAAAIFRLPVAGAFHSPLMEDAQDAFAPIVASLPLRRGSTPLVSSVSGDLVVDVEQYRRDLSGQICAPVRWDLAVRTILEIPDVDLVELGASRVLRSTVRDVDRTRPVVACHDLASCEAALEAVPS
jgi:[acyl-carrier-protein] S-malonyltransferase